MHDFTHQWVHNDVYPDPKHFEKSSLLNSVLKIMPCISKERTKV